MRQHCRATTGCSFQGQPALGVNCQLLGPVTLTSWILIAFGRHRTHIYRFGTLYSFRQGASIASKWYLLVHCCNACSNEAPQSNRPATKGPKVWGSDNLYHVNNFDAVRTIGDFITRTTEYNPISILWSFNANSQFLRFRANEFH